MPRLSIGQIFIGPRPLRRHAASRVSLSRCNFSSTVSCWRTCASSFCLSRHSWRTGVLRPRPAGRRSAAARSASIVSLASFRTACALRSSSSQPVLVREALGSRRNAAGGRHEAVPTPKIAFPRNKTLPGFKVRLQARAFRPLHDADLAQPPRQLLRRLDVHDQAVRHRREAHDPRREDRAAASARSLPRDRRFEIVAECRAERRFIAGRDADEIDSRRIGAFIGSRQQLGDRLAFGRERIGREAHALRFVAPGPGVRLCRLDVFFRGQRLGFDLADFLGERLAAIGDVGNLLAVRRFRCQVLDLCIEAPRSAASIFATRSLRSASADSRLRSRARASAARCVMSAKCASVSNAARFGRLELASFLMPLRRRPCSPASLIAARSASRCNEVSLAS